MSDALAAFLADRDTLDAELLAAARADAGEAARMKELLIVDDLLSRALAPERGDFANRVLKRVAMEHSQRHFVRRVAEATRQAPSSRRRAISRPVRAWLAPLAAAAVLVVALVAFLARPTERAAPPAAVAVATLRSSATLARDGAIQAAEAGAELRDHDEVRAERDAALELADGTRLSLSGGATLRLDLGGADGRALRLDRGALEAVVAHQPAEAPLLFLTPQARARVVGTRFTLAVADGVTRLSVAEGRVAFRDLAGADEAMVGAGGEASAGAAPAAPMHTLLIDACDDASRWSDSTNTPHSPMRHAVDPAGRLGGCMRFTVEAREHEIPWAFRAIASADWRSWEGISLWVSGSGSGVAYDLEIIQREGAIEEEEHFIAELIDNTRGWKQVRLPFTAFQRRPYQPAARARHDGLRLDAMAAVAILFSASAELRLDQIELYRR